MNKQIWKKKCLLFEDSYASNPTAIKLFKNIYRVFYSSRDKENKSSLFFDFDIVDLKITNKNKSLFLNIKQRVIFLLALRQVYL